MCIHVRKMHMDAREVNWSQKSADARCAVRPSRRRCVTPVLMLLIPPSTLGIVPNWQSWAWLDYNTTVPCNAGDDHHCFGNGACMSGECSCNVGWRGAYCSQLDLLPARRAAHGLPLNPSMPTWGGSAVFDVDEQRWHLLTGAKLYNLSLTPPSYAEWSVSGLRAAPSPDARWGRQPPYNASAEAVGIDPYGGAYPWDFATAHDPEDTIANPDLYGSSYLMHMRSAATDPAGPYELVDVNHRAFRADLKSTASSSAALLLLTIGTVIGSTVGRGMVIKRSGSGSANGPWDERVVYEFDANGHGPAHSPYQWDCDVKDPSFVVHANGTTVIAYRAVCCPPCTDHTERVGLLVSSAWNGTYTRRGIPLWEDAEDLFMWTSARGTHMIYHSQATDHGTVRGDGNTYGADHKKKRGGYAFSADGLVRWSKSEWECVCLASNRFLCKRRCASAVLCGENA